MNQPPSTWATLARAGRQRLQALGSLFHRTPYSVLSIRSDAAGWVLDEEARALNEIAMSLGLRCGVNVGLSPLARQCCHHTSQHALRDARHFSTNQRVSVNYFHGTPHTAPEFEENYRGLRRHHPNLTRVRVSHSLMEQVALEAGVDASKVRRIPISIGLSGFSMQTAASRAAARARLDLPQEAIVVGSFQKDGVGWEDGFEPKLIKGPDVLLRVLTGIKASIPELWVLLTGPARGFVRNGLVRAGIPFRHVVPSHYSEMGACYQALDAYLVTSRDEGGPKALLESMATGVPLITTRVGQAIDLARPGENAWVAGSEDVEALTGGLLQALGDSAMRERVIAAGRRTAEENSHDAQQHKWAEFFKGYVEP